MNSDQISHKLSYAKLYKKYDWVIATGVYLDDVSLLIENEQKIMKETFYRTIRIIVITTTVVLFLSIIALISFERRINKLISGQTTLLLKKNKELSKVAFLDPLTGIWNRRAMYDRVLEEASRCRRSGKRFCIIMGDIDFFKKINDTFGHKAGDLILKELALFLKDNLREGDNVSRWGGEEFLILVNNSDLKKGAIVAEKLKEAIVEKIFMFEKTKISVTITLGVAEFYNNNNIDEVIDSADKNLYTGKNNGRNRVVSA
jgi:diguanylate cyclase (GGDEF)-like protein